MTTLPAPPIQRPAVSYRERQIRAAAPFAAWACYGVLFAFHVLVRSMGDELLAWRSLGAVDTALTGRNPSLWLQERFYSDEPTLLDRLTTGTHLVWFAFPIAVGLAITIRRRDLLIKYLGWLTATWFFCDLFFLVFPVLPPWMVDEDVSRVLVTHGWLEYTGRDSNPVAAFPSLHACLPAVVGFFVWAYWRSARWLALISFGFAVLVGFSVIYLGEHWLVDVAAGFGAAWVIRAVLLLTSVHAAIDRLPGRLASGTARLERRLTGVLVGPHPQVLGSSDSSHARQRAP